jgi:uncharacterized protein
MTWASDTPPDRFDLGGGRTYDTRPMPDGSKLHDVLALAEQAVQVKVAVPVAGLERLAKLLAETTGIAEGEIAFSREQGQAIAHVKLHAELSVVCQRCMVRMQLPVDCDSRVALVESEEAAQAVPAEFETALAPGGRLRLRELVEEELLLALPAAPRHTEDECVEELVTPVGVSPAQDTHRPFADLGGLLGSGRSKQ